MAKNRSSLDSTAGLFKQSAAYAAELAKLNEEPVGGFGEQEFENNTASIDDLYDFENHPFRVIEDEKMHELAESIKEYGVQEPLLVRPRKNGLPGYEIISGHRREHAAILAGLTEVPVTIKDMDDDLATIIMVDSNNKREELLISEKAKAYRMKAEALNHQGKRNDLVSEEDKTAHSADTIGASNGESARTIQRYVRMSYLVQELLDLADSGKLSMATGIELSYLSETEQDLIVRYYNKNKKLPSTDQAKALRAYSADGELTEDIVEENLTVVKTPKVKVTLNSNKLYKYFPKNTSQEEMEDIILRLLQEYADKHNQDLTE